VRENVPDSRDGHTVHLILSYDSVSVSFAFETLHKETIFLHYLTCVWCYLSVTTQVEGRNVIRSWTD
jgi:hypothetical protein